MAGSANRRLVELSVSHQIGLNRYSSAVTRRAVALLNRNDPELIDELVRRQTGLGHINSLLSRLAALNRASVKLVGDYIGGEMEGLSGTEVDYQRAMLQSVSTLSLPRSPTAAVLKSVVYSQPFEGGLLREWVAGLEDGRMTRLRQAIRTSIALGESADKLVSRVRGTATANYKNGILDISRRSASAMVRTAVAHVASGAREAYYAENADIISGVQWVSVLDTKTSSPCRKLDGTIFKLGRGPRPPAHIGCRSTTCAVLKSWQEMGLKEEDLTYEIMSALDGQPPSRVSYQDWLAVQPVEVQNEILGVTKGILFRQGSLVLGRFADASGQEYTLAQLRARDRDAFIRAGLPV